MRPRVRFGDFAIDCLSRHDLVHLALSDCEQDVPARLVFDANGHALSLARTDASYRKNVQQADLIHADGGFLVTLSKRLNLPEIPERSATTDMIHDFAAGFSGTGHGFFLLGGEERVNRECSDILSNQYPGLKMSGRRNGFFSADEEAAVVEAINASGAAILWVGLGKPKEQDFCVRWRDKLNVRWIISCGGCYNYITGDYGRAPDWMQRMNIEWIHRMATEPRKLFWRYAITTPHALWIALRDHGAPQDTN
ncbi:WecB/TagA/CpsF family glycosyltransferase [Stenotrophomonas chelatiphaga]|uniref:WecB/TagA/CpsF family glycosyltransferase n=1 Tax=Stenotrophomonas chelatiphaga TaxID=517011 RepID=UPI0028A04FEC|nr:WecB/TagA/CpsF family glycosyltransferase [Stenotrophomonas chelatiphaga]